MSQWLKIHFAFTMNTNAITVVRYAYCSPTDRNVQYCTQGTYILKIEVSDSNFCLIAPKMYTNPMVASASSAVLPAPRTLTGPPFTSSVGNRREKAQPASGTTATLLLSALQVKHRRGLPSRWQHCCSLQYSGNTRGLL